MREVDAIALVLRDFGANAHPLKELTDLLTEMILSDMAVVENRRARLKKKKPGRWKRLYLNAAPRLWRTRRV